MPKWAPEDSTSSCPTAPREASTARAPSSRSSCAAFSASPTVVSGFTDRLGELLGVRLDHIGPFTQRGDERGAGGVQSDPDTGTVAAGHQLGVPLR